MKKILLTISAIGLLSIPLFALAITGENARFDWSNGIPAITDDTTNTCNNQAVVRFDWSSGIPAEVFDTTATCAVVTTSTNVATVRINGQVNIQGGVFINKP